MTKTFAPLRILALTHSDPSEGCTYARIITPLRALEANGFVTYKHVHVVGWRPWSATAFRRLQRDLPNWDLIWLARPAAWNMLLIMREAKLLGKPVLVDLDDWLPDVPAESPDAAFFRSRPGRETIRLALRTADGVTTSTPILAERCASVGARSHVLPNVITRSQFERHPHCDLPVTIAFCGSASHTYDVALVRPALQHLLQHCPKDVRIITVGCPIPELQGLVNYSHYPSVAATDYPRFLSTLRIDIGLAPLHDTPFNRAKSDIKHLEYAATGAATIASDVAPYRAGVGQERGVLVSPNTPEAWFAAILRLVDEPHLRQQLATNAHKWVCNERSIEATAGNWTALFREYADKRSLYSAPDSRRRPPKYFERELANIVLRELPYYGRGITRRLAQKVPLVVRGRGQG